MPYSSESVTPMPEGTVLLIEDDDAVCRMISRALRGAGYLVHASATGEAALEFVRAHAGPIDLLVTDTVLPGMNGVIAAQAIRLMRPGVPVLQMSGYRRDAVTSMIVNGPTFHFIEKPFRGDVLVATVRTILANQPAIGVIAS
jgi:two-component system cell cycle sensor histidine kinase/response regulator CckA